MWNKAIALLAVGGVATWIATRRPKPKAVPQPGDPDFMGPVQPVPQAGDPNFMGPVQPVPQAGDPNFMGPVQPVPQTGDPNFMGPLPDTAFTGPIQDPVYALVQRVAQDLRDRKQYYDRALLRDLQDAVGILRDGLYGPDTQAVLIQYGISDAPLPYFYPRTRRSRGVPDAKPSDNAGGTAEGVSELGSVDPAALAQEVAANLASSTPSTYARDLVKLFQRQVGLPESGLYDGVTRGALIDLGADAVTLPEPFVRTNGSKETVPYFPTPADDSQPVDLGPSEAAGAVYEPLPQGYSE